MWMDEERPMAYSQTLIKDADVWLAAMQWNATRWICNVLPKECARWLIIRIIAFWDLSIRKHLFYQTVSDTYSWLQSFWIWRGQTHNLKTFSELLCLIWMKNKYFLNKKQQKICSLTCIMTVYGYSKPSEVSTIYHTGFLEPQVRVK